MEVTDNPGHPQSEALKVNLEQGLDSLNTMNTETNGDGDTFVSTVELEVYADDFRGFGDKAIRRWKQFLGPFQPMPRQGVFNKLLRNLSERSLEPNIYFIPNNYDEVLRNLMGSEVEPRLGTTKCQVEGFKERVSKVWSRREGIKEEMKRKREQAGLEAV